MSGGSSHIPVLLNPLLAAVAPVSGTWVDGTFGAGGYAKGLLSAGASHVIGIDRDPLAHQMAADWIDDRITLIEGNFSEMDKMAPAADGVVLDLGVSSMQLDLADRGFSFQKDGPLDMRMGQDGPTAADLVNTAGEGELADILYIYGEERASRRIARAIVAARTVSSLKTTLQLADIVSGCLPRPKPGQTHPATRSFQAFRIAVNDEYGALHKGLMAAERALVAGGKLAVVTFHSVEDRMVKRFLQSRAAATGRGSRHAPEIQHNTPRFALTPRKAIAPDADELATNPRSRSAKLRVATRTDAASGDIGPREIAMPTLKGDR
ncbi:MAG: 16S rRNA (cytosine(1402)-N(4))-methyltransferase RsmH [Pseudoprimorskyibacter sp.]|nr:16S rRNA (cytosine(1402)-N(4))-methyltransferase RsmH [Pseudoprimorskyibacter sp.]